VAKSNGTSSTKSEIPSELNNETSTEFHYSK
jgi:hypothetical protein